MVTATEVIDLDLEFDEPTTRVVDSATERASIGEASTSGTVAPMISVRDSRVYRAQCSKSLQILVHVVHQDRELSFQCHEVRFVRH
ncbi:hypothetical protein ACOSP7_026977 [Xanthoceras sorbifolium]